MKNYIFLLILFLTVTKDCFSQVKTLAGGLKNVKEVKSYLLQTKNIDPIEGLWGIEYLNNSIIKERGIESNLAEFATSAHVLIISLNGELKMFQVGIGGKLNEYDKVYYEKEMNLTVSETFGELTKTSQTLTYLLYSSTFNGEYHTRIKIKDNEFSFTKEFEKRVNGVNPVISINRYKFNFIKIFPN